MDKEVLREIWHGQLPLCFKLHPDYVIGMHSPEPYYMMVPRITYFPLVLDRVIKHFNRFMDQNKQAINDMWLDYDGQPIKWHHPIGLSWDLLGSSYNLPWILVLHFSDFPAKELIRCNTKASIESSFMSSLKEADALKHRGSVITNMVKKDHLQLWSGLLNDKFEQFWYINQRLMERKDNKLFRFIPFRIYLPDYTYLQKAIRPCTTDKLIFINNEKASKTTIDQVPIGYEYDTTDLLLNKHQCIHQTRSKDNQDEKTCLDEKLHRCTTMLDLIQISFMDRLEDILIQQPSNKSDSANIDNNDDDDDYNNEKSITTNSEKSRETTEVKSKVKLIDVKQFKYRFLSHGIEIPFEAPLQWLSEHLSYPDNFLHICVVLKDNIDN